MKLYVGYILGDFAIAVCASLNKTEVEKTLEKEYEDLSLKKPWIKEYDLHNNQIVTLEGD